MKEMFTRTQFAVDQGGYFPEIKVLYDPLPESNCSLSVQVSPGSQHSVPQMLTPSLYGRFQALSFACSPKSVSQVFVTVLSLPGTQQSVSQEGSNHKYPALSIPGTQDPSYPSVRIVGFPAVSNQYTMQSVHEEPHTMYSRYPAIRIQEIQHSVSNVVNGQFSLFLTQHLRVFNIRHSVFQVSITYPNVIKILGIPHPALSILGRE
jgi:hypothetical protein